MNSLGDAASRSRVFNHVHLGVDVELGAVAVRVAGVEVVEGGAGVAGTGVEGRGNFRVR